MEKKKTTPNTRKRQTHQTHQTRQTYKNRARFFLKNYLKHNKICINYNQWFFDIEYRQKIAKKLQMEFSDAGIDIVLGLGGGSSFDGKQFDGQATSMNVLNRYTRRKSENDF